MKKTAFTLVELLAVIVILGVITSIAIPNVISIIDKQKKTTYISDAKKLVSLAEAKLRSDSSFSFPTEENPITIIKLEDVYNGDIETDPEGNPYSKTNSFVAVTRELVEGSTTTYEYVYYVTIVGIDKDDSSKNRGVELVKTKLLTTDDSYTYVKNNITLYSTNISIAQKILAASVVTTPYTDGTVVYYNPVTNLKCDLAAYTANTGASNNGTKAGCMKWYTYNSSSAISTTVNLLLDHNTTAQIAWNSTGSNTTGMKEVQTTLTSDTATWNAALNSRLMTAPEAASITGYTGWTTSSTWYYFASKTTTQLATCTSPTFTGCTYTWLYDRTSTDSATTYGALNNASGATYGFWTSSIHGGNTTNAWIIDRDGYLISRAVNETNRGVRPVITVKKSSIQ